MIALYIILFVVIIYMLIPSIWGRHISQNVIRKVNGGKNIALTFDDGPDKIYTMHLLEVLNKYNVKVTFFMLAKKAQENPNIVKAIKDNGHEIEIHSYNHRCQLLHLPLSSGKDISRSIKTMSSLGIKINLFRPPWGLFNLFTIYYINKFNLKGVFWTRHAFDWSKFMTLDKIKNILLNNIKAGDIILLHDSNENEKAPPRTIEALDDIIPKLQSKGFKFITLKESMGISDEKGYIS